jgi:hypothetical protein
MINLFIYHLIREKENGLHQKNFGNQWNLNSSKYTVQNMLTGESLKHGLRRLSMKVKRKNSHMTKKLLRNMIRRLISH